jgi:DNA-binding NtrC family response regulator
MNHHVLIVDDDELVLTGLASGLEREGYRTSTALSGQEALALLPDGDIDAVLADMVMDEMDGLELLDLVVQRHPQTPVLILTGHGTAENALLAMRRGAADYIQKPARAEEIARRIRDALDARQFQQRLREQHETDRERRAVRQAREEPAHGIALRLRERPRRGSQRDFGRPRVFGGRTPHRRPAPSGRARRRPAPALHA